jgi:hypothetical protein
MADAVPDFPLPVRMVYRDDGSTRSAFIAEVDRMTTDAKQRFETRFAEIGAIVERSLSGVQRGKQFRLEFDLSGLRQAAADADHALQRLVTMRAAAQQLAAKTNDTSSAAFKYAQALQAQVSDAEAAKRAADDQVRTYSALQTEMDGLVRKNAALAQSYRDTYAEQARATNFAHYSQAAVNAGFGLSRTGTDTYGFAPSKSAAASAAVFENFGYKPSVDLRQGADAILAGKAALDAAAASGTTLDQVLGRVASKGPAVGEALDQAGQKAAAAARRQAEAEANAAAELDKLTTSTSRLLTQLDPVVAAQQRLTTQMDLLDRALAEGVIDAQRYGDAVEKVATGFQATVTGARAGTTAFGNVINSQRAMRVASLQAGQQLQDVAISLYSGQRAGIVFAQQLPQLAFALSGLEGSANRTHDRIGRFATFLSGPWGLAIGLAVGVTAELAGKLLDLDDSAEESGSAVSRLKDRLDLTKNSYTALIAVVEEYNRATERTEAVTLAAARAAEKEAASLLAVAKTQLADLKAGNELFRTGDEGEAAGRELAIRDRETRVQQLEQGIRDAERAVADIQIKGRLDPVVAAQQVADQRLSILEEEQRKGLISTEKYEAEKFAIQKATEDRIEAIRKAARETNSTANRQIGREIDLGQAKSIAQSAGFHVTSDFRTREEQQYLYDHKRTAANPVALPGTSAHERGNALDIAFGPGVDPASLRKAYADEGVKLTKILKETGHFHIEWSTSGADKAEREARQFSEFASDAAARVASMQQSFNDTPPAVARANDAMARLRDLSDDIQEKVKEGLDPKTAEALQAQIERAEGAVRQSVDKPFNDMLKAGREQAEVQGLIIRGRAVDAEVLDRALALERDRGRLSRDQLADLRDMVVQQRLLSNEVARQNELRQREASLIDGTRDNLHQTFSDLSRGGGIGAVGQLFKRQFGLIQQNAVDNLFDSLFGNFFRDEKDKALGFDKVREASDRQVDSINRVSAALDRLDTAAGNAGRGLFGTALSPLQAPDTIEAAFDAAFANKTQQAPARLPATAANDNTGGDIVVEALRSPRKFVGDVVEKVADIFVDPDTAKKIGQGISDGISGSGDGAAYGMLGGGLVLGRGGSPLGSAIGGALGEKFGEKVLTKGLESISKGLGKFAGPVGAILGGLAGGLIGSLFGKKPPAGQATITNGAVAISGNSSSRKEAANTEANSVISGLDQIAERLGGTVGNYLVSIGVYKDQYRVNYSGSDIHGEKHTAAQADRETFANEQAAIEAAIRDAIKDGAVAGLGATQQYILQHAKDIDRGVQDVLDFQSVFDQLKAIKDPVGAAIDTLDKQFRHLKTIFDDNNATTEEYAQLEELYGLDRAKALKEAQQQVVGSLQSLRDQLATGDTGLSLRDRQANALADFNPLRDRLAAGDRSAYDDFANAAGTLLDLSRQLYGSQSAYFSIFDQIKTLTDSTIQRETDLAAVTANRDSPFSGSAVPSSDNAGVISAIEQQTAALSDVLNAQLSALNRNVGALIQQGQNDNTPIDYSRLIGNFPSYF